MTCRSLTPYWRRLLSRALPQLALVLLGGLVQPAWARDDHEQAYRAVQAGEVMPLRAVLERLEREHAGQVLDVELERENGRWIYEIKLLQPSGQRIKLEIDARTADVIQRKTRAARP